MRPPINVTYRAVHKNTAWRKSRGHTSLENALHGHNDGAPGLFEHRARIDYEKHGEPLYVIIWVDGEPLGYVVKKDSSSSDGTIRVQVDVGLLRKYDDNGGATVTELEAHFSSAVVNLGLPAKIPLRESPIDQAEEGALSLGEHLLRERNAALVEAKKADVFRATGRLACEACCFDFAVTYGEVGNYYCEVHHTESLGARKGSEKTSLQDLVVLCSNCHSIIHRTEPMWSVNALVTHLKTTRTKLP